jgi:predicted transcriptional regulator
MPLDPDKIRARREALKLTQTQAAQRAGMPQPHWARIESGGRSDPNLSTAERVARALDCSLARLSTGHRQAPGRQIDADRK